MSFVYIFHIFSMIQQKRYQPSRFYPNETGLFSFVVRHWDTICATKPCTFTQIRISRIAFLMINFRLESILFLGFFIVCAIYIERKRFSAYVAIICDIIIVYNIRNLSVLCMNKGCYCVPKIIILEWILCRVVSNWYSMITFQY
jgi:hypothetical protein